MEISQARPESDNNAETANAIFALWQPENPLSSLIHHYKAIDEMSVEGISFPGYHYTPIVTAKIAVKPDNLDNITAGR